MFQLIKFAVAAITALLVSLQSSLVFAQSPEPTTDTLTPEPTQTEPNATESANTPTLSTPAPVLATPPPTAAAPPLAVVTSPSTTGSAALVPIHLSLLPNPSPLKLEGSNGSIKFGLLFQPQLQATGSASSDGMTRDVYLRRIRFMLGGTLLQYFDYFWQVDSPNLFKTQSFTSNMMTVTQKGNQGTNLVDAFTTFKPLDNYLKLDAGYFLPPLAHNYIQGAGTLLGSDFFANTYRASGVFGSAGADPGGRDLGAEIRGLLLSGHVEYRAGIFQGVRKAQIPATADAPGKVGGRNPFRVAARLAVNFLDADPSMYYSGTYLGAKKMVSLGGSYDTQGDYKYWALDAIVDLPWGPGVISAQANFVHWDGGTFIPALPNQHAFMAEAGYVIKPALLSPILRYEDRRMASAPTAAASNEKRYAIGLAFWPFGHSVNLKAFYSRIHQDPGTHDYDQINAQWQVYFY